MQNISSRPHSLNSEAGRPLCHACLSLDRDLVPFVDNTGLFWYLLGHRKFSLEPKFGLLCWECMASFKKIWRFQKRIQTAQLLLQQTYYSNSTLQSLSTLTTILIKDSEEIKHEESLGESNIKEIEKLSNYKNVTLEVNLDKQITSCKQEKQEEETTDFDIPEFSDEERNEINESSDEERNEINEFSDEERNEINEFSEEKLNEFTEEKLNEFNEEKLNEFSEEDSKKEETKQVKTKRPYRKIGKFKITKNCEVDFEKVSNNFTKVYLSEKEIEDVIERENNKGIKYRFPCKRCKRRFKKTVDLKRHMTFHHEIQSAGPYSCLECDTSVPTRRALHTHWAQHNCVYKCKVCGALHQQLTSARRHVSTHAHVYTCCICNAHFMAQRDFHRHYKALHKQFICDHCGKVCKSKYSIQKHMIVRHLPPRCRLCGRDFTSYKALDRHNREWHSHLTRAQCSKESAYCVECNKQYNSLEKYRRHLATAVVHIGKPTEVRIPCPDCGKIFNRKLTMSYHYNLVHMKSSKYYCELCDKYFVTASSARKHKRAVHDKVRLPKTKVCDICGRAFARNRILTNHRRTHTGERPHKCKYCASAFAQSSALVTHVRTQHRDAQPSVLRTGQP